MTLRRDKLGRALTNDLEAQHSSGALIVRKLMARATKLVPMALPPLMEITEPGPRLPSAARFLCALRKTSMRQTLGMVG